MNISLLGKWMPSVNTSSKKTRELGKFFAKKLHISERNYRKMLSELRKKIDVVERKMSAGKWNEINYENVPSHAMKNYYGAFYKHDEKGFEEYINQVKSGEKTIKSSAVCPYDLFRKGGLNFSWGYGSGNTFDLSKWNDILEEQWKALPNYVTGKNNILVMADTSGSMNGDNARPLQTSLGLAIYFAERNRGAYKNLFMTFSTSPRFVELSGNTVVDKISGIESIVADTNLEKAFELILEVALENHVPQEELPKALIIITDMQFNSCITDSRQTATFYTKMKDKFSAEGYKLPNVIFWNVSQRRETYQNKADAPNVFLVSGHSPSTFRHITNITAKTPEELMYDILDNEMYNEISLSILHGQSFPQQILPQQIFPR